MDAGVVDRDVAGMLNFVAERRKESRMSISAKEIRHWTRDEYERMVETGVLQPEDRVELVEGVIYNLAPQNSLHATGLRLVEKALGAIFTTGYDVRTQLPLALGEDSEPEPDVAVVQGETRDFRDSHPSHAVLVVEVSDSSSHHDRNRKARLYARSGIVEYWILNVSDKILEVYRDPSLDSYRSKVVLRSGDTISPLSCPQVTLAVSDLLP